jgi:Tfp pilus assembly protein FimT
MKKKSITLVELLVGIAITLVLASVVLVSFSLIERRKLEMAGREMVTDFVWARQMAVSTNERYIVTFDRAGENYSIFNETIGAANLRRFKHLEVDLVNLTHPDWSGNSQNYAPNEIRFIPMTGSVTDNLNNPINFGWVANPRNFLGINLNHAGRNLAVGVFGETGFVAYRSNYVCFIATAAYGGRNGRDIIPEEVIILQKFRDEYLLSNIVGKTLVDFYYLVSPSLASYIENRDWAKKITRTILRPVVYAISYLVD